MKDEALSLYIPEDLESDMRLAGVLENSWGNGISAAIMWVAENCDNLDELVEAYVSLQRERRALTPCRRTSAVLTAAAYTMLKDMTPGDMKMAPVVKAVLRHFVDNCQDIPAALAKVAKSQITRPKSVPAMPIRFDYETLQHIRTIAVAANCSDSEVVLDIVKRAVGPSREEEGTGASD